ncbi:MAG: hypothetical protein Q8R92_00895 [Deltaproteobacteria bacterium]|nr:hypothetical protein [Deltaproteobacteria bacterium]
MPRTKAGIFKRPASPNWYVKVKDARGRWIMRSTRMLTGTCSRTRQ